MTQKLLGIVLGVVPFAVMWIGCYFGRNLTKDSWAYFPLGVTTFLGVIITSVITVNVNINAWEK